ncbi:MAG: GNAT family N-acetyltransferase [bacterium]|nr:GNAT family N-acetyltransferase [bacterium]
MIEVPEPYTALGAGLDDIEDIWRLMVTVNMSESGTPGFGFTEIENWLTGDWIEIGEDVAIVRDGSGAIVAVELFDSREPYVRPIAIGGVHPDHVGRGLGHALLSWAKRRAKDQIDKAPPDTRVTFGSYSAQAHKPSTTLMSDMGLEFSRYFMDMEIEFDGHPVAPQVPDGVTIRLFDPETELAALALVTQEAFRDHYGFVESPMETRISRLQHWMNATDHDPALWWVAEEDGELVAHNLCFDSNEGDQTVGYVGTLGVLRSHRGRGLGRALLLTSFGEFYGRGKKGAALGVDADSLTGATQLYESVGMHSGVRYAGWELELRPGLELATVEIAAD